MHHLRQHQLCQHKIDLIHQSMFCFYIGFQKHSKTGFRDSCNMFENVFMIWYPLFLRTNKIHWVYKHADTYMHLYWYSECNTSSEGQIFNTATENNCLTSLISRQFLL